MRSWPASPVPRLEFERFGPAPALRLYDSATGSLVASATEPLARMYVCGITPYDAAHVGHAATYVGFDLVVRTWMDAGHAVDYVQNVTDVDDPLFDRARSTGEDWRVLAERETERFRADMTALRVLPPREYVGAQEAMPLIATFVADLAERGAAYQLDGDWYFPVDTADTFGSVSHLTRASMLELFAERGGDPDRPGKKDPLDCLVWQRERPGDPSWDSALGRGRPGWHVECTAIALRSLGASFDVQGGGNDLAFPHHEMCAAQGRVWTGEPFARAYVHAGMVGLDGAKMSKSRGNLIFVSALRDSGADPMAIRLALLGQHYRAGWEWTSASLDQAQDRLARWRAAAAAEQAVPAEPLVAFVREALAADLDTPRALKAIDEWAGATLAGTGEDGQAGGVVRALCDARLGVAL